MTFEMNNSSRQKKYQRSEKLETLMDDVNNLLLNPEKKLIQNCHENQEAEPPCSYSGWPVSVVSLILQTPCLDFTRPHVLVPKSRKC
jgi:hypothetical protein